MNNSVSQQIQSATTDKIAGLDTMISVIIFIIVGIFVARFVYSFIRGYQLSSKGEDEENNEFDNEADEENYSMTMKTTDYQVIICNNCGEENDADANFCKNCGNRLN